MSNPAPTGGLLLSRATSFLAIAHDVVGLPTVTMYLDYIDTWMEVL